jgi:hypothetical protein
VITAIAEMIECKDALALTMLWVRYVNISQFLHDLFTMQANKPNLLFFIWTLIISCKLKTLRFIEINSFQRNQWVNEGRHSMQGKPKWPKPRITQQLQKK